MSDTPKPALNTATINVFIKGNNALIAVTGVNLGTSCVNQLLTITANGVTIFQSVDWSYWQPV